MQKHLREAHARFIYANFVNCNKIMSDKRKIGPVRQLSLQSDQNHRLIRPILKKQLSVEQLDRIEEHKTQPRVESAKNKLHDRPRPIKVAWAENRPSKEENPVLKGSIDVKKCKEHKRPTTATPKLRTQSSVEKESVLYTRQELAERLRKAWKEREDNKQNLDIFLNQHHGDKHFDDLENENYYPEYEDKLVEHININEEKIIAQFKPTFINTNNTKNTNKVCKSPETTEFNYIPSTTSSRPQDVRTITNISVTIPSVNSLVKPMPEVQDNSPPASLLEVKPKIEETPKKLVKQSSLMSPKENLPPSRPHTASAASKREGFGKRTNTAFTGSVTDSLSNTSPVTEKPPIRAPLIRALSVPAPLPQRPENNKLKFLATKRRLKSARKRNNKEESQDEDEKSKKGSRCKSAPNGDVVTMVSLVSPAGSDTEDVEPKKEQKGRNTSPVKTNLENVNKTIALRKSVKSVSFQQSSIHAVRSFSASFPSRRGILTSSASISTPFPEREKRAPMESTPGELRGAKRRLVKSFSVAGDDDIKQRINSQDSFEEQKIIDHEIDDIEEKEVQTQSNNESGDEQEDDIKSEEVFDPNMPKFETNKEKECWVMYKKMCDKGLPVAFDTILRGMLTPTEYRNVRKETPQIATS